MYGTTHRFATSLAVSLLIAGWFSVNTTAQNSAGTITTISPSFVTGVPAGGSFDGDQESINMANGNLNVRIPLLDLPGLGGFDFKLDLVINSKQVSLMGGSSTPDNPGGNTYEGPGWETFPPFGNDISFAGGRLSIPAIYYTPVQFPPPPSVPYPTDCDGGIVVVDTDGSQHAFQNIADCIENGARNTVDETPSIDDTLDGSFMRLDTTNPADVIAYLKSGVQYHFNLTNNGATGPLATKIVDPNGNQITISQQWNVGGIFGAYQVAVTDSENRAINITNQAISYTDANGIPQTISASSTTDRSGPDVNLALEFCRSSLGSVDNPGPYNLDLGTYETQYTLLYPNNASYALTYDSAGELTKIVYPSGGYTRYDYQGITGGYSFQYFQCIADVRQVVAKHVCPSSSGTCSSENTTTYTPNMGTYPSSYTANQYMDVRDASNNHNRTRYEFSTSDIYGATYGAGTKEVNRYIYSGESTLLRTIHTDYTTDGTYPQYSVRTCSLPEAVTTTLNDGSPAQQSQTDISYGTIQLTDSYYSSLLCGSTAPYIDNPISKLEYDYDGSLKRYTTLSWNTQTPSAPHILDRLSSSTISDANGDFTSTVSNTYDSAGNLLSQAKSGTNVSALTTQYQRNVHGDITQITDPKQNVTTLSYDNPWADSSCPVTASGKPSSVTNALGQVTKFTYATCTGNPVSQTDSNSQQTTFSYDSIGRLASEAYPDGGQDRITYVDSVPESITTSRKMNTTGGSIVSTQILDGLGREVQTQRTSDPQGTVYVDTTYNATGQVYSVSNPYRTTSDSSYGLTVFPLYDGLGRKESQIDSDGTSTQSWGYSGNTVTFTDEASHQWQHTSDALGRLTQVVEPGSFYTTYQYDVLNNLRCADQWGTGTIGSPCASSRERYFEYDGLSRLTFAANPESSTLTYTYDANGNVLTKIDGRGITTGYSYDALNRLTLKDHWQGGSQIGEPEGYGYDGKDEWGNALNPVPSNPIGRLTHASNEVNAAENYWYDPMGRLKQEAYCTPQNCSYTNTVQAQYDLAGNLTSLTYPDASMVSQSFDGAGRLSTVGYSYWNGSSYVGANYLTVNSYDAPGHVTSSSIGGGMVTTSASYNSRLEISSLAYNTTPATVWSKQYTWTPNGNLQQATDVIAGTTRQFGYDALNRITSALDVNTGTQTPAPNGLSESYTYDAFGNLWESGNFTFWPEQYTNGNEPYGATYDAAGNLVNDGLGNLFTWDEEGRVSTANGVTYSYNAVGERVGKSGSGATDTIFFGGQPIARLSGGTWTDLIYGGGSILAEVPSTQAGTPVYRLADHLGSSIAMISSPNPPYAIQDYAPFGQLFNGSSSDDPYKFTGKERDTESGDDYFGARYYSSAMGIFMSPDWSAKEDPVPYAKLDNPQTLNLYAFVENNPLSRVDFDGHEDDPGDHVVCSGSSNCHTVDDKLRAEQQRVLPDSPAGLGEGWKDVTPSKRPAGKPRRYKGPKGTEIEFDPGESGEPGWSGKDHWHEIDPVTGKRVKGKGSHLAPGAPMPGPDGVIEPEPTPREPEPQEPEPPQSTMDSIRSWLNDQWQGAKNYLRDHPYGPNSGPGPYFSPVIPSPFLAVPW